MNLFELIAADPACTALLGTNPTKFFEFGTAPALAITHKTDRFNRTTALVSWMSEWPQRRRGVFPPPCPCSLPARATQRA